MIRPPFWDGLFDVLKPKPQIGVSQWSEAHRILPQSGSAEPGPWRNARMPYLVEVMDELSASSRTKEVVFCKGSQIGATEAGINWLLYLIDHVPGPILALQPTDDAAMDWSKQRVAPSIDLCERTKTKVASPKSRTSGNTILKKEFDGGYLFMSGTNSPTSLASLPIGNLFFDEVDRYPDDSGGEGDPINLALRRIATYPRAKAYFCSTPTLKDTSRIWKYYQDSDRRVYKVPCPHCGEYQEIKFDQLRWVKGQPEPVYLACAACNGEIHESHKTWMLEKGTWIATNPGHRRAGFHLSSLYSPAGWLSWEDIVRLFEEAHGKYEEMKVFVNTILGLPWEEDAESIAEEYLKRRVEKYRAEVPDPVLALTMQVDVQNDWIAAEVTGWGLDEDEVRPASRPEFRHLKENNPTRERGGGVKFWRA